MIKQTPKTEVLFVKITKVNKKYVEKKSRELFGTKRKESMLINSLLDELRTKGSAKIETRNEV